MTFMVLVPIGLIILVLAVLVEAVERLIAWVVLLVAGYFLVMLGYEYAQEVEKLILSSWVGALPGGVQFTGLIIGATAVGLVVAARDALVRTEHRADERRWADEEAEREAERDAFWEARYRELGLDKNVER